MPPGVPPGTSPHWVMQVVDDVDAVAKKVGEQDDRVLVPPTDVPNVR